MMLVCLEESLRYSSLAKFLCHIPKSWYAMTMITAPWLAGVI